MPHNTSVSRNDALIGAAFVFAAAIAFSAKAIFIKLAYAYSVDAVTLMALRMLIATPFFVVMAFQASRDQGNSALAAHDWGKVVALGLAGMYFSQLFDFLGLEHVSAGMERTILFLYPTFVVVISSLFFGKPVGLREIAALILSYAGVVLVAAQELSIKPDANTLLGAGFVFISAMTYAGYMVGSGPAIHKIGTQRFTGYTMIVACTAVLGHFFATHPITALDLPIPVYELGFVMAMVSTVLPLVLLNAGIRRVGGSQASLIGSIGPVSTVLLAAIFLGEVITGRQMLGTALVLVGVLIITIPQTTAQQTKSAN